MVLYSVFKTGLDGDIDTSIDNLRSAPRYLPDNIYDALANFRSSEWITKILGDDVKGRFADLKQASADRCARLLGTFVKAARSAVPPRDLQPISVESILVDCSRSSQGRQSACPVINL